jgi:Flp pilus assembly protein TadD
VIGSGNHSKTFVHRDVSGRLREVPVSWYSERGGYWAMSPGYDRPDHSEFWREIPDTCLFCHNGYPSTANGGLAMGIDCQRCHGPGEAHVQRKGAIVNPAKISRERQMDVCMQCHLESASRTLPDAIRRSNRGEFSYRPGEPLGDFKLYFEFEGKAVDDRVTVNSSAYGLRKSMCFKKSSRMTCTTCHDPHGVARDYTAVCRGCHAATHDAVTFDSTTRKCVDCHMQKRRTEDAVHVVITDHLIRRRPLAGDLLAPIAERHDRESGRVKLLYPERLADAPESRLYMAMAQVRASTDPREDVPRLERAIEAARPSSAEPYLTLGEAYRKLRRTDDAIVAYRNALARAPNRAPAYVALAELLTGTGEAVKLVEQALKQLPANTSLLNSLSVLYARQERFDDALGLLSKALQIDPDDPLSWLNLGVCLQAKRDGKGAEAAYRQALLLQPDLTRARNYLTLVLKDKL